LSKANDFVLKKGEKKLIKTYLAASLNQL